MRCPGAGLAMKSGGLKIKAIVIAVIFVCAIIAFGYRYFHGGASAVNKSKETKTESTAKPSDRKSVV